MKILAIDTSCDDTCVSILETRKKGLKNPFFKILSNIISSQVKFHKKYGGVVPGIAKREHQKNLLPILQKSLENIKEIRKRVTLKKITATEKRTLRGLFRDGKFYRSTETFIKEHRRPRVDLIAVTQGPGLEPALWTGVNFARAISYLWKIPITPVNHIEGHIFSNFLARQSRGKPIDFQKFFPALCLIVSGGHTEIILMKDYGKYKLLGETRDDAAGECLDKVAKLLGLSYPGGPKIEKLAKSGKDIFDLPRPMKYSNDYDFSFSGLKTAVLYLVMKTPSKKLKDHRLKANIATSVQESVIDILILKAINALGHYKTKTILLGGGVVANRKLRSLFKKRLVKKFPRSFVYYPPIKFCTDNAAMIGAVGYFNALQGKIKLWQKIRARANLKI
ncbi:MAG: tRNA (adenosine(37)-N6)-threonylcarbamoyltransferase complex transferase subunit TsaD [Candidatus Bathyarchaeota archaeon]|nr:tRNA (adenosine(37)-N6)-threonylcarbamoyltransferase complex transferase subunit TsaD [Candidatus Bathyarchaeota archaeon]